MARDEGVSDAFDIPGFVPAYIRPLFCEGKGPFRWVALSGDPADIAATDRAMLDEFADDEALVRWIKAAYGWLLRHTLVHPWWIIGSVVVLCLV